LLVFWLACCCRKVFQLLLELPGSLIAAKSPGFEGPQTDERSKESSHASRAVAEEHLERLQTWRATPVQETGQQQQQVPFRVLTARTNFSLTTLQDFS